MEITRRGLDAIVGHDVRHQSLAAWRIFTGRHSNFLHIFMFAQCAFDLSQLDAEAPDFDLVVDSAQKFDIAIGQKSGTITRAIQPIPRNVAEWIGDKFFRRQFRTIEIAPSQTCATHAQLSRDADGHWLGVLIEHINFGVIEWNANRNKSFQRQIQSLAFKKRAIDGRFGQAKGIEQSGIWATIFQEFFVFTNVPDIGASDEHFHEFEILT